MVAATLACNGADLTARARRVAAAVALIDAAAEATALPISSPSPVARPEVYPIQPVPAQQLS